MFTAPRFLKSCALLAFLTLFTMARAYAGGAPIDGGTGAFAAAQGNVLYSVDFDTGKAVQIYTDTTVSNQGINSVGMDTVKGIFYYVDNNSVSTNKAIFGYDTRTGQRFTVTTDVTTYGVTLPSAGLGGAGGEFANNSYYFSTEGGGPNSSDQFYRVVFDPASNGRTIQRIDFVGLDNFQGATEFGDFLIDESTQRIYVANSGVGVDAYQIGSGSLTYIGRSAKTTVRQAARDRNNVLYMAGATFYSYDPTTGNFGTPQTITTDGSTALGDLYDAAAFLPAESSIGGHAFFDENTNGTNDSEPAAAGLTVELFNDLNNNGTIETGEKLLATTTTDSTGAYLFGQLLPGDYIIRISDPNNVLNGGASTTGGLIQRESVRFVGSAALNHDFGFQDNRPTLTVGNATATEGTDPYAIFTVSLSQTSIAPITVSLATADVTATKGSDYGPGLEVSTDNGSTWTAATTATFASGKTSVLVRTPVADDTIHENSETFTLTATVTAGSTKNPSATGTGTIVDNDPLPSFSINNVTRNEKAGSAVFTVTLSAASGLPASVDFATADGTATAGSDYTATSGTLNFPAGTTTQTITVPILDDNIYEGSETYNVVLSNPAGATIGTSPGVGTILDNGTGGGGTDDDRPTLSVNSVSATEGTNPYAVFTVSLSNASVQATGFNLTLATGTASTADFGPGLEVSTNNGTTWTTATSGTIAAGATSLLVRTPVIDDTLHENTEAFTLTATTTAGTTKNPSATGTGTIIDNDPPPTLSINNVTRNEKAGTAVFTVTLSTASGLPASVDFATADVTATAGANYTATSGTLNFPAGTTTQTITVPILDDNIYEGSETYHVVLSNPSGATIATGTGTGTILDDGTGGGGTDDDRPTLSVGNVTVTEGTDMYAVFPVTLTNPSVQATSFNFALTPGTASTADFGPGLEVSTDGGATWVSATSGTIAAGVTSLKVRTPIIDDTINEPTEQFTLTATTTAGTTKNPSATGTCSIIDNDPLPSLSINDVTVSENAGHASFTVTLSTASGQTVTVHYATSDGTATAGSDYTATSGNLTFNAGTTTQTISVPILDDSVAEPTETFNVTLSSPVNSTISHATGVGTILDDDGPPNHPPVANNDTATTPENTPVDIPVLANDTDQDNDPLTVTVATVPPAQGTVSINPNGTVHYVPASNFTGPATISYSISDGKGGTASATVAVTVTAVNHPPIAVDNTAMTPEGQSIAVDVLANDSDPDSDPLTVTGATLVSGRGTVTVNPDHTVEFTPAAAFTGPATVVYTISDGHGGTASANLRILVDGLPVATDDFATTTVNTAVTIPVLGNDRDPEGLPLTIVATNILPSEGTFSITGSQLLFTPAAGVVGTVRGQYTIRDQAGNVATANVTIDITSTAAPAPPVAQSDSTSTTQRTPVNIPVLQNDNDPANGALTVISATVPAAQGTVKINFDNSLTFTAAAGFSGTADINYIIRNPAGATATAPALVQVAGGDAPPLARPDFATAATATPKVLYPLLNDTDPDGDPLTITSTTLPAAQGSVEINPNGTVTFTSAAGFSGTATIGYQISDGRGGASSSTITVVVSATPVNQPPVPANDTATTKVDQPVDIAVLVNDRDPDGDPLTVISTSVPAGQGTATVNPDGTIHYIPAAGFNGDIAFTYTVSDGQGGSASAIVTVNINDTPRAAADRVQTPPGTPITISVLSNDTDPNGNGLTLVSASVDPAEGTVVLNGNGTLSFTPAVGFHGIAEVPYVISDSHGGFAQSSAFITVNNPPTPVDDTASTPLGQPVIIAVLTNDTDPDGDPLTVTGATIDPTDGTVEVNPDGTITFTPSSTFVGPVQITYTVSDPSGAQASAHVIVTRGDAPPTAQTRKVYTYCATALFINALRTATDADGDPITILSVSKPRHGKATIMPNGVILYKPNMNYTASTTDTITVTLSDGKGGTTTETITVHAFAAIAGTFQGLLTNMAPPAGGGAPIQRGRVTLTMNGRASVTANVQLDGSSYRLVGTLQGALTFAKQITFHGESAALSLVYDDLADAWTASLTGATTAIQQDGSGIERRATAARHATTQTVFLVPQSGVGPNGSARLQVSASGAVTVAGVLPNGTRFSSGAFLNKPNSAAAIFHWLPVPADNIAGAIQVPKTSPYTAAGTLQWNDDPAGTTAGELLELTAP